MRKKIMLMVIIFCMISSTNIIYGQKIVQEAKMENHTFSNQEESILSIIKQIDEDMMLGYIEDLVSIAKKHEVPRLTGTKGCEEAREFILNEFMSYGISVNIS